ncbi:MAG: hypothetical protein KJI69_02085 [Patescibacteria group bacterium]|nr:hypothetical protein [Patescibacteria group bacterium]
MNSRRILGFFVVSFLVLMPLITQAEFVGQTASFSIDQDYDVSERKEIPASLVKISSQLLFYVDDEWWGTQNPFEQSEARKVLDALTAEFGGKIYPQLRLTFGSEWKPGIDADERITVLFHPMKDGAGGYTNYGDELEKVLNPNSNEREMVYLSTDFIRSPILKSLLAHEFVHLITFNQKERLYGIAEDIWLNEARAEYAVTLLGYDSPYEGSNLQRRVNAFLTKTDTSLLQWDGEPHDYGAVNLFSQYIVDQYGLEILRDSLRSDTVGIQSIEEALKKNGFAETFEEVFTDWTIALLINDCDAGVRYCYQSSSLKDFKVVPQTNFLPLSGESTLSLVQNTKDWAGNWYRIVGGKDNLKIEFRGNPQVNFKVPYVVQDIYGNSSVAFLQLDSTQKGEIELPNFNNSKSITILPSIQTQTIAGDAFSDYQFVLIISSTPKTPDQEEELKEELLERIVILQAQLASLQAQLNAILFSRGDFVCQEFTQDLFWGMQNNVAVNCLQQLLKGQGQDIYPEGIISGNFLNLTRTAVMRFQAKYAAEILTPLGLTEPTGFVGASTRQKLNEILEF